MVFCIVGIVIFGVLGIFSAKYRTYFRESVRCLTRQLTLRKCDTDFDNKVKAHLAAAIGKRSATLGRFIYKRFALLSWIMVGMLVFSVASLGVGIYNTAAYGNCNGEDSTDFCLFNPGMTGETGHSMHDGVREGTLSPMGIDNDPTLGNPNATVRIVEVGCYRCPYTKKAEPLRQQILEKYGDTVSFTFRALPLPNHDYSWEAAEAAECAREQNRYWDYHDTLFEHQKNFTNETVMLIANELGLDTAQFGECVSSRRYYEEVKNDHDDAIAAGIYATPTFFVNGQAFVGPRAFGDVEQLVVGEIHASCD